MRLISCQRLHKRRITIFLLCSFVLVKEGQYDALQYPKTFRAYDHNNEKFCKFVKDTQRQTK